MLTIFTNPDYDFIGRRRWAYAVSVALMLLALGSIVVKGGLQYDIDFTGGTLIEVRMPQAVSVGTVRARLAAVGLGHSLIQQFGDSRDILIRTQVAATNPAEVNQRVRDALAIGQAGAPEIRRVEYVGPQIGHDLRQQAMYAVLAALGGILLYIWIRFDLQRGRGHDRECGTRRPDLPRRAFTDEPRVLPARPGRSADGDRLRRQRSDRDV